MELLLPIVVAGVLGGWALLTLVGGERTRRIAEFDAIQAAAKPVSKDPTPPKQAAPTPAKPVKKAPPPAATKPDAKADSKAKPAQGKDAKPRK